MKIFPMTDFTKIKSTITRWYIEFKKNPEFKVRKAQLEMIRSMVCGFEDQKIPVIEADTGTGKSLANLMVGWAIAKASGKKLVLSTSTIQLQMQLLNKDIPQFQEVTGESFNYTLLKGQGNYFCPLRADDLASRKPVKDYYNLKEAFENGWDGDFDNLTINIQKASQYHSSRKSGRCLEEACPYKEQCPYGQVVNQGQESDVLIINHSLLLAIKNEGSNSTRLPEWKDAIWILDEAHQLPNIALNQQRQEFALKSVRQLFFVPRNLHTSIKEPLEKKLLPSINSLQDFLREEAVQLMDMFDYDNEGLLGESFQKGNALLKERLIAPVKSIRKCFEGALEHESIEPKMKMALKNRVHICEVIEEHFEHWCHCFGTGKNRWVDKSSQTFACLDVRSAAALDCLWSNEGAVALTSATISIDGNFSFFESASGIQNARFTALSKTFDYDRQRTIEVSPSFWWHQKNAEDQLIAQLKADLDLVTRGGVLVLFTSSQLMKKVRDALLSNKGYRILMQTEHSRKSLIEEHKSLVNQGEISVIFGLRSCGEGLDLPGDYCRTEIITKLDFDVPTEPEQVIRKHWYETQSKNYFREYVLPIVGQRLKQASGRLIRTETDIGILKIYDPRVLKSNYRGRFELGHNIKSHRSQKH